MRTCEHCGSSLPDSAGFCGYCGQFVHNGPEAPTYGSDLQADKVNTLNAPTSISTPHWPNQSSSMPPDGQPTISVPNWGNNPSNISSPDQQTVDVPGWGQEQQSLPLYTREEEDEEEERRRRAALLGLPLLGVLADMPPSAGNTPMVQGTPQVNNVPFVHNTPPLSNSPVGANVGQGWVSSPNWPTIADRTHGPSMGQTNHAPLHQHPTSTQRPPHLRPSTRQGCAPTWFIFVCAFILIISGIIGSLFTLFTPNLTTLSGSADVAIGGSLSIHGSRFLPASDVTLTLDGSTPLYYVQTHSAGQLPGNLTNIMGILQGRITNQPASSSNIVHVGGDGTFNIAIAIDQHWQVGQHTLRASEKISPRSAVLTFTVHPVGYTPTATPTDTTTPSVTASPSTTATGTVPSTGLSCINPSSLALGSALEGSSQPISSQVTLCTSGTGTVNWTAAWDTNAAPWLHLDMSSGQIQAPAQQAITVSGVATGVKAGNYSATVNFSSTQSGTVETLNVTFTVQASCIKATPGSLTFTGVASVSDPASQPVSVNNCGFTGSWSAAASTDSGGNWLGVSPKGGNLNGGASQSATISASNLTAQLAAGSYTGKIVFSSGSSSVTVYVTLTVQAAPNLVLVSPTTSTMYGSTDCQFTNAYACSATISNSSNSAGLNWTASSSGIAGIAFSSGSSTLSPGGTMTINFTVPRTPCGTPATITFSGPANSVSFTWYACSSIS